MSYDENSEYQLWALKYQNNTKETSQSVSSGYFYVALIVWILPPFIFTSFLINSYRFCLCSCKNQMTNLICPILSVKTILLPIGTIVIFLLFYLIFPFLLLLYSICKVILGEKSMENNCCFDTPEFILQNMIFVETVGEALPQFILNVVFICNNYEYLLANDVYFGIPLPISIISSVFSLGSLIIGFINYYQNMIILRSKAFKRFCCKKFQNQNFS